MGRGAKHFARPHVGKQPLKYYFRAQDISLQLPGFIDLTGKLMLTWKRGHRKTTTSAFPIKEQLSSVDGSITRTASTLEDLALVCTMFKSARRHADAFCLTVLLVYFPSPWQRYF